MMYNRNNNSVYRFLICMIGLVYLLPVVVNAQQDLNYNLNVKVDLTKRTFDVHGSLSFLTGPSSADSLEIVISKCTVPPLLKLSGAEAKLSSAVNSSGDIAYTFKFAHQIPSARRLVLHYQYQRGALPTFQYCIDSIFCMAGGYGSAWYPQLTAKPGSGNYIRGTGTISVTTAGNLMAVMAASTLKTTASGQYKTFEFHYTKPDIFSLYIGNYTRQEYKKNISFYTYSLSSNIDGAALSQKSAEVLDFLTSQFGQLDIPNFSIIEFPEYIAEQTGIGGASMLGGVLMPTGALQKFNYALFGHEIGHQWWGNKIMSSGSKGESMLSEGMAQYGSLQVVSHFDSLHAMNYRKTGYPGYINDQSGLGYLKNAAAGNDEPLSRLTGINDHILGDSKGFLVLELLSQTVGKSEFNRALKMIGDRYSRSGLSWDNFLKEIETVHGSSLQWFYRQWFDQTGAPAWQTTWQQKDQELLLHITQKDAIYQLPLEVLITYADGKTDLQKINISEKENLLKLAVRAKVTKVTIDPYFKVVHWDDDLTPAALALGKVQQVNKLRMEQKYEEAEHLATSYLQKGMDSDPYGLEFSLLYYLGRIKAVQHQNEEALAYYLRAVKCPSTNPDLLAYAYYRIAQISASKGDKTQLQWATGNAVKADEANNNADGILSKIALLK